MTYKPKHANATFDVLSHQRRRDVLSSLQEADADVVTLAELVDWLPVEERERDQHDSVKLALHHVHLPKLSECGLVDYDARTNTVRYYGRPELERTVALADEMEGECP